MRATTRPGGRPRRPGPPDQIRATGTRHRRPLERRAPDPGPRAAWAFALVALVVGVGITALIVFGGASPRTAAAPTATPTTPPTPVPSLEPTDALAVTGDGVDGPVHSSRAPITPPPTATDGARMPPATATLRVEFPQPGDTVASGRINAFGRAPAGSSVVRDMPDGTSQSTSARDDGLWIMAVALEPGANELRFRIDGSGLEPVVVSVTWQPR